MHPCLRQVRKRPPPRYAWHPPVKPTRRKRNRPKRAATASRPKQRRPEAGKHPEPVPAKVAGRPVTNETPQQEFFRIARSTMTSLDALEFVTRLKTEQQLDLRLDAFNVWAPLEEIVLHRLSDLEAAQYAAQLADGG